MDKVVLLNVRKLREANKYEDIKVWPILIYAAGVKLDLTQ
jgi:hypothetical protein